MQAEILTGDTNSGENVEKEKVEVAKESSAKVGLMTSVVNQF